MLDIIDILDVSWMEFVQSHPEATVFHHPLWSIVISQNYGYRPFIAVMKSPNGQILAGLPMMEIDSWLTGKRWVALPFTDHCCPLLQNEDDLELFTRELIRKCNELNAPRIEIRHDLPLLTNLAGNSAYYIHYLRLDKKPEELFKLFRQNNIRCIKKALKLGIVVSQSWELESMKTFYKLHLMTRKKLGVPTQPRKYFLQLWERIIKRQMGFIMLAYYESKAIAGVIFLHYNKKLIYKYGATDPDYLNLCGNHALFWEVIQWGCRNGFHLIDWGRTDKNQEGLRHFKLGWGTEEKELSYSYIGSVREDYSSGWKQKIIDTTIRKSPVWVGRVMGELLYKHVG